MQLQIASEKNHPRMAAALARQGPKAAQLSKQVKFYLLSITCFWEIVCSEVKCGLSEAAITSGHFKFQYSIMNKSSFNK